ncbi:MAG: SUF system Fe-S cluster assembly regulator [Ectothiorhodospiraceae bacterium]
MIKINRETDYATAILSVMAEVADQRVSAGWLATQRGLPPATVSKILKQLVRAGILVSHRGARGGYSLARAATAISVAEVVQAMEGSMALTDCIEGGGQACRYSGQCTMGSNWERINEAFYQALEGISISDMSQPLSPEHPSLRGIDIRIKTAAN